MLPGRGTARGDCRMQGATVPTRRQPRQAFPRWHLVQEAGSPPEAAPPRHSAKILRFPDPRGPAVVTYPRALVLPRRPEVQPAPLPPRQVWTVRALMAAGLAGLLAAVVM